MSSKMSAKKNNPGPRKDTPIKSISDDVAVEHDEQTKRIIEVRKIVRQRDKVRLEQQDFQKSDILRDKLRDLGVEVLDQKNGPSGFRFLDGSSNKLKPGTKIPDEAKKQKRKHVDDDEEVTEVPSKVLKKSKASEASNRPEVASSSKF